MEIAIDGIYQLVIPRDILNDKITYVTPAMAPKYTWWKELNGKHVKVKAATRLVTDFYSVVLVKDYSHPFYVSKKFITESALQPLKCACESFYLFWRGCLCGAFKREQELE